MSGDSVPLQTTLPWLYKNEYILTRPSEIVEFISGDVNVSSGINDRLPYAEPNNYASKTLPYIFSNFIKKKKKVAQRQNILEIVSTTTETTPALLSIILNWGGTSLCTNISQICNK